jgi:hypothetical protein
MHRANQASDRGVSIAFVIPQFLPPRRAGHGLTEGGLQFGQGEPAIRIRFTDRRAKWLLLLNPDLQPDELCMDGRLIIEQGDIAGLLATRRAAPAACAPTERNPYAAFMTKVSLDRLHALA